LPFKAQKGLEYRFSADPKSDYLIEGKWAAMFESSLEDSTFSMAQFKQEGSYITGTFLTTTGDYRYLQGELNGNKLSLSCFDGEHAFLFKAEINENKELNGVFKSGKTWNETWQAVENNSFELADPYALTYLKPGFDSIFFKFQNLEGDSVEFPNSNYNDKAVLIQIFGTWCPNCMDETVFLSDWYNNYKKDDVKILALAYERKNDLNYAGERINKMKKRLNVNYDFLFAGGSDKEYASSTLPMLNTIISFPTLIILDKEHNVRKIHTGFSGPGTGEYYEKFKLEFDQIMDEILSE
jgi:thiol-disulfide isomerase/thioredoxin